MKAFVLIAFSLLTNGCAVAVPVIGYLAANPQLVIEGVKAVSAVKGRSADDE
jgi:hypothetical protein